MLEIITRGYNSVKIDPTVPPMPTAAAMKAHPSARSRAAHAATMTARSAKASSGSGTKPVLSPTCTQVMKPKETITATSPIAVAARAAPARGAPRSSSG